MGTLHSDFDILDLPPHPRIPVTTTRMTWNSTLTFICHEVAHDNSRRWPLFREKNTRDDKGDEWKPILYEIIFCDVALYDNYLYII